MLSLVRVVGVIPAAGFATRLAPLSWSKEVYPVGGRPVLEYLVDRMRLAPASEIRIVTRPEKRDVLRHARRLGLTPIDGRPETVSESVLLGLHGVPHEDTALLGFPDTLWEPDDGFATLIAALDERSEVVLGCFRSPEPERSDVVVAGDDGIVHAVQVKPELPASDLVWGCCAARVGALAALRRHAEPGGLFDALARRGVARCVRFPGELVDIGTPESLQRVVEAAGAPA
jgi:glucose-1-phosphate thymidylyltransferase